MPKAVSPPSTGSSPPFFLKRFFAPLVRAVTPPPRCGAGRCGCWLGASLPWPTRFSNWSASTLDRWIDG